MYGVSFKNTSTWNGRNIYNGNLGIGSNTLHYHLVSGFCFIFLNRTMSSGVPVDVCAYRS